MVNFERASNPEMGKDFIQKEYLTQSDIQALADDLVKEIQPELSTSTKPQEKTILLLDGLSNKYIFNLLDGRGPTAKYRASADKKTIFDKETGTAVDFEEIKYFLGIIRKAVLESLRNNGLINDKEMYFIEDKYRTDRALGLNDNVFYKQHSPESIAPERNIAIEILKQHPHPNICFSVLAASSSNREILLPRENLTDLEALLKKEQGDLKLYLQIILDNIQGAIHLVTIDLALGDILLSNLGFLTDKRRGALFDFDILVPANKFVECSTPAKYRGLLNEQTMVGEFGKAIQSLIANITRKAISISSDEYSTKFHPDKISSNSQLATLARNLTDPILENRPTLVECAATLQEIIDTL